jgi:hypothetical protein
MFHIEEKVQQASQKPKKNGSGEGRNLLGRSSSSKTKESKGCYSQYSSTAAKEAMQVKETMKRTV